MKTQITAITVDTIGLSTNPAPIKATMITIRPTTLTAEVSRGTYASLLSNVGINPGMNRIVPNVRRTSQVNR